ncbi:MAG TPA: hypothetical protein VIL48_23685 [Acidimicrobiales bacterium]
MARPAGAAGSNGRGTAAFGAAGGVRTEPAARAAWAAVAAALAVAVPVVVALAAQRHPAWHPLLDHAQTELRVRDVFSRRPPLVGLPGRFHAFGEAGSHPGPLSFWAMAPTYRLLGADPWALQAAGALLHVVAAGVALALARRRGGTGLVLAVGLMLAALVHGYGVEVLTLPWNPYLPVLWWPAYLLAGWSALCGDRWALPVAVVAGSFCAQTHLPYAGLVAAVGGAVLAALVLPAVRARLRSPRHAPGGGGATGGGVGWRWAAGAAGLLALLWLPPLVEQLTDHPGNAAIVVESLRHPVEARVAAGAALEAWLVRLDPIRLAAGRIGVAGSVVPGATVLAAWLAAAVGAWRFRHAELVRLHGVVGVALAGGLVSVSRISGRLWDYLVLWGWGTTALALLAIGWTVAVAVRGRAAESAAELPSAAQPPAASGASATELPSAARSRAPGRPRWAAAALATALAVTGAAATVDAAGSEVATPEASRVMGELADEAVTALERRDAAGEGRYLVDWVDPRVPGSTGYGLVVALERHGFRAGLGEGHRVGVRPFRTLTPGEATAELTIVSGPALALWRADPAAVEVAAAAPTPAEEAEARRLRADIARQLRAAGAGDVVPLVDENLMAAAADPRVPDAAVADMQRLGALPLETAVFLTAPQDSGA